MNDEQELIKSLEEKIAQKDFEEFFYGDRFWGLRKLAIEQGWKKVKDIDLVLVKSLVRKKAYESIIRKILPYKNKMQDNNDNNLCKIKKVEEKAIDMSFPITKEFEKYPKKLSEYMEYNIDEIFSDSTFYILKNFAKKNKWKKVKDIQFDKLVLADGIGQARIKQIRNKLAVIERNITCEERQIDQKHIDAKRKIEEYIKTKTMLVQLNKYIPISEISLDNVTMGETRVILEELKKEQKISYKENGVRYIFKTLMEQIEELPDERNKIILKERLSGKTYEEIAKSLKPQITRERVRQCIEKVYIRNIVYVEENKYYAYYKKYHLGEESFCQIFHEPKSTYRFLKDMSSGLSGKFKKEFLDMLLTQTQMDEAIKEKIQSWCHILKEEELNKIKNVLEHRSYSVDEMKEIFESIGMSKAYINRINLDKLNFAIGQRYIIPKEYENIDDYMKEKIFNNRIMKLDNQYQYYITKYLKEHRIIRISKNEYANVKHLKENTHINEETLIKFENEIVEKFEAQEYFSIANVKEKVNVESFEEIGLDDSFYETQIELIDGIIKFQIDYNIMFYKQQSIERGNNTTFIEHVVKKLTKTSIENLQDYIEKTYKIQIHYDILRRIVMYSNLYYEPTIQKAYINKDVFYEDIFE